MAIADSAHDGLNGAGVSVLAAASKFVSVGYGALIPVPPARLASSLYASMVVEEGGRLSWCRERQRESAHPVDDVRKAPNSAGYLRLGI